MLFIEIGITLLSLGLLFIITQKLSAITSLVSGLIVIILLFILNRELASSGGFELVYLLIMFVFFAVTWLGRPLDSSKK